MRHGRTTAYHETLDVNKPRIKLICAMSGCSQITMLNIDSAHESYRSRDLNQPTLESVEMVFLVYWASLGPCIDQKNMKP